jgi:hypothetical protein
MGQAAVDRRSVARLVGAAHSSFDVERVWDETVHEQTRLLEQAAGGIDAGAANFDEETLGELGCFDPRVNGAGTVTAAGAIYLASRHAADPHEGCGWRRLARGADTDTLASMTCGLLGAAIGGSWTERYLDPLQDAPAIAQGRPCAAAREDEGAELYRVNRKALGAFAAVSQISPTAAERGCRPASSLGRTLDGILSKVRSTQAAGWRLQAEDGQTYFLKVFSRASARPVSRITYRCAIATSSTGSSPRVSSTSAYGSQSPIWRGTRNSTRVWSVLR